LFNNSVTIILMMCCKKILLDSRHGIVQKAAKAAFLAQNL